MNQIFLKYDLNLIITEIIRQSLYTRDIQTTSKLRQICGHLRSYYARSGCMLTYSEEENQARTK